MLFKRFKANKLILCTACACFMLVSCTHQDDFSFSSVSSSSDDSCSYRKEWSYNQTHHWHQDSCGHGDKIDLEEHIFVESGEHATYEYSGRITYTCSKCGYNYSVNEPQLQHNYSSVWSSNETAHWHACTDEGYSSLKSDYANHVFVDTTVDATFEENGYIEHKCSTCDYSYRTTLPKLSHNYSEDFTYNEEGHWHACIDEGYESLTDGYEEHDYKDVTIDPTFEDEGLITHTCKKCGYSYEESIDKLEHNFDESYAYDENGHWHPCKDEGYEDYVGEIEQHVFSVSTVAPTFEEKGYDSHVCEICGYELKDNYVDKLEHNYSSDYQHDDWRHWHTCTDEGYENLKTGEELHDYEIVNFTPATFTEYSYTEYRCRICGFEISAYGQQYKEHSYGSSFVDGGAYHYHQCTDEGYEDLTSEPEDHKYGQWVIDYYPENGNEGLMHRVCEECGHTGEYTSISSNALYGVENFSIYYNYGEAYFSGINNYSGEDVIILPTTYNDIPITRVNGWAFNDSRSYSMVIVPEGYETLDDYAFYGCNASTIILPSTLRPIYSYAFEYCTNLQSLYLPQNVSYLGSQAFYGCTSLETINIPDSVNDWGNYGFYNCSSLKNISLNTALLGIPDYMFYGCSSLEEIYIPDNYSYIGQYAFYECSSLKNIHLPSSLYYLYGYTFYNCDSLTYIEIPDSVTQVNYYTFYYCDNLSKIVVGSGVTYLGYGFIYESYNVTLYYKMSEEEKNNRGLSPNYSYVKSEYYYSQYPPLHKGNYWHYVNGVPALW